MTTDDDKLAAIAGAILDGEPVDWAAAESDADDSQRSLLASLRMVATLADVHRQPLTAANGEPAAPGAAKMWGHLRVLEAIGAGAYGKVYRAWDTTLDREVALKLLPASPAVDRHSTAIIEEGRLLARVHHPHVVTIYGADRIGQHVGLWMEFVHGRTLARLIEERGVLDASEAVRIGAQLCEAVSAVHAAGLLHRDIKAQNVMLADDGRVVLMDFGAGREVADTSQPSLAGTPLYLAPEVLESGQASMRSDVYSIGVLLHHLLTGDYPVRARDLAALRRAHREGARTTLTAARIAAIPPALARLIDRATERDPARRPADAAAFGAQLAAFAHGPRRRPVVYVTAAVLSAALALLLWAAAPLRDAGDALMPASGDAFGGGTSASAVKPVVAVLPLKNLSAESDSDYFVDGLTDEIIRHLAVVEGLAVRSQTSSFAFKDRPRDLADVAARLGVNLIVEGSVLRDGARLRVNVQLVRIAGEVVLWSGRFDRELEDVFAIQDEISRAIVNELRLTIDRGQRRYDTDLAVYERYLRGRLLMGGRIADARRAVELFERVIADDPSYAPAYAGLASAWAELSFTALGVPADIGYERMRPAAEKALALDPMLAEAHAAMGLVHSRDLDWDAADASFRRAIALNPNLASTYTHFVNSTLFPQGRLRESLEFLEIARAVGPLDLDVRRAMANVLISAGEYDAAIAICREMLATAPEAYPPLPSLLARALVQKGELAEAIALHEQVARQPDGAANYGWLGYAYAVAGRRAEAEGLAAANPDRPARQVPVYAGLGDKERVFAALERMAAAREPRVGIYLTYPELALVRDDPRVAALKKQLGLR